MSVRRVSDRRRPTVLARALESLESRMMLCAESHAAAGLVSPEYRDLPESVRGMFSDGHITAAQYATLSPDVQALINPHEVEDARSAKPVNFDEILGIPTGAAPESGPEAEALPDFYPAVSGSFSIDQTSQPGRTLLRFGTQVNNAGMGPGSLLSGRPGVDPIPSGAPISSWLNPDGSQNVLQAVYNYNSTNNSFSLAYYRAAGRFTYHQGHGHFHYDGYANYKLRARNPDGSAGAYVTRADGTGVVGAKTGFCLINVSGSFTMLNGQSSTSIPSYNATGQPSTGCGLLQGVSVGRADVYSSSLEGQWLDVTGVPNGQYFLEMEMDGENAVLESDDVNNIRNFAVTLNANPPAGGISPDEYDSGGSNNNTLADATDYEVMGTFTKTGLNIHWGQDQDWFKFVASSTGSATVRTTPAQGNVDLYLYDDQGNQIGSSTLPSGADTVTYNFVKDQTYYAMATSYNSTTSSNYQIAWTLKPTVTNGVEGAGQATELGAQSAKFLLGRNGPTSTPLTINFTLGGSAVNGVDYQLVTTSVTLGDLQTVAEVEIVPLADGDVEALETVTLTITSNNAYVIGGPAAAQVTIADTPPQVTGSNFNFAAATHDLAFNFTLDVSASLGLDDLTVLNLGTNQVVPASSVSFGDRTNVGTFRFASPLPDGNYRATLSAAGVTHALGAPLPGNAVLDFFVFAGDFNRDRTIDIADFSTLAGSFGLPGTYATGDANYDGTVDIADFSILASKFNTSLPAARAGASTAPVGSAKPAAAMPPTFGSTPIERAIDQVDLINGSNPI